MEKRGKLKNRTKNVKKNVILIISLIIILLSIGTIVKGCIMSGEKNKMDDKKDQGNLSEGSSTVPKNTTKDKDAPESTNDNTASQLENSNANEDENDPIKGLINKMTLQEKIGQMIIVGFEGFAIDDNLKMMIEDYKVGGVILFSRNVKDSEQLLTLNNALKSVNQINEIPLFISVDEEGGKVSRIPNEFNKLPTNRSIGRANDEQLSYEIGRILAEELKIFGFNMNFAPVLDISSNPQNPVIGDRSFGDEAKIVSKLGIQTMLGISNEGIIPVIKHFPGHGDTSQDSHIGLPVISHELDRLMKFEIMPFKKAIDNQSDAVMIAHILLDKIDPKNPSSLSKVVITDILRNKLEFDGVVITDDLTMGAIVENYEIGEAAIKSIKSGSDIVLVCHGYKNGLTTIEALKNAVDNGIIPEQKIDNSVYRILKLKERYKLTDDNIEKINKIDIEKINKRINSILESIN